MLGHLKLNADSMRKHHAKCAVRSSDLFSHLVFKLPAEADTLTKMLRLAHTRLPLKHDDKSELIAKQQQRAQQRAQQQLQQQLAVNAAGPMALGASRDSRERDAAIAATRARLGI